MEVMTCVKCSGTGRSGGKTCDICSGKGLLKASGREHICPKCGEVLYHVRGMSDVKICAKCNYTPDDQETSSSNMQSGNNSTVKPKASHYGCIMVIIIMVVVGVFFWLSVIPSRSMQYPTVIPVNAAVMADSTSPSHSVQLHPTVTTSSQVGVVTHGGNLRTKPQIAPNTVIGQVCIGDRVSILERSQRNNQVWYYIRVVTIKLNCDPHRVSDNQEGWIHETLIQIQ